MSKEKSGGALPKMEFLIILVFFASFIIWAVSKCNARQEKYVDKTSQQKETPEQESVPAKVNKEEKVEEDKKEKAASADKRVIKEKVTTLYVILDGLKLRKGHHLDSTIVKTLSLDDELVFLGEVSDFRQRINLGDRIAYDPWIKVRAYTGHEGWVYGAGVRFFKKMPADTVSVR